MSRGKLLHVENFFEPRRMTCGRTGDRPHAANEWMTVGEREPGSEKVFTGRGVVSPGDEKHGDRLHPVVDQQERRPKTGMAVAGLRQDLLLCPLESDGLRHAGILQLPIELGDEFGRRLVFRNP